MSQLLEGVDALGHRGSPALSVEGLVIGYPGLAPVHRDIGFRIDSGVLLGVVGPNGIGKTTLLATLAGMIRPVAGTIVRDATDVTRQSASQRRRSGVSLVPEGRRIFPSLTVEENIRVAWRRSPAGSDQETADEALERCYATFPVLAERRAISGSLLSGGEQQMLAIARATVVRPDVLLADEPFRGLHWKVIDDVRERLRAMSRSGIAVVVADESERSLAETGVDDTLRLVP